MELGDWGTIMLRDEDYNYRHNKKLINYLFSKYKDSLFISYENENDLLYTVEKEKNSDMISYNNLKYHIKKILAKYLFYQIGKGLLFLHNSLVSHRDLKPDNIVFCSKDCNIKIIDFSISVFFNESNDIKNLNEYKSKCLTNEPGGSIHFQAPEQFETGKHNPFIADIWSLGISLYIFICEKFPYDSDSELELQIMICEGLPKFSEYVDDKLKNLILRMIEKDISKRIGLEEFLYELNLI